MEVTKWPFSTTCRPASARTSPSGCASTKSTSGTATATRRALVDFSPRAVSHQAAQASVAVSVREPHFDAEVNVMGGINLLDACASRQASKKVVFASTGGAIYGEIPEGHARRRVLALLAAQPVRHLEAVHRAPARGAIASTRGLRATVLRYANVYGPRQDPLGEAGVVAVFFDLATKGETLRVNARRRAGDAGCVRDYVYVGDVGAHERARARRPRRAAQCMNVGERRARPRPKRSRARSWRAWVTPPRASLTRRRAPAISSAPCLNPALAERALGSLTELTAGLAATHEYYSR